MAPLKDCPRYIMSMCPVCGILVGGHQEHPNARGIGADEVVSTFSKKKQEILNEKNESMP